MKRWLAVYAVAFTIVMALFGLLHSPWAVFAVPSAR